MKKSQINAYAIKVAKLDLYQVGELNELFDQMGHEGIKSPWLLQIKATVQSYDEEKFKELLNIALSQDDNNST